VIIIPDDHEPPIDTGHSSEQTSGTPQPFHNGRTEGVNTKTKMIKRQMYGRAGFTLLRHRILLG
jgi:Transposase